MHRPDGIGGVAEALAERTIVKTWAMRCTLHLLAVETLTRTGD